MPIKKIKQKLSNLKQSFGLTGRILFSFWLTLILFAICVPVIFLIGDNESEHQHNIPSIKLNDELTLQLLTKPYSDVKFWLSTQNPRELKRIFVIYQGKEILNRPLPNNIKRLWEKISNERPFVHNRNHNRFIAGRDILLPNGEHAQIILRGKIKPPAIHGLIKNNLISILFFAILISGLISYFLARNISKPILSIRKATQDLAAGDLSVRVQSHLKPTQDELYLLAQDFDVMADKLDRTISSHKHLIQDISHELRSPIARLQLALELAKKRLHISDDQVDILRIEKECEQINQIISTLLNLPAYELDPHLALEDSVDIPGLLSSICDDLNYAQPDKPIKITDDTVNAPFFSSNQQLLRSAFENVFKNAQQYHQGTEPIQVHIKHSQNEFEINCCDNGPGTHNDKLEEIFKPFYREDPSRARESGGFGLGLAISKRAIILHQGQIKAYNRTEGGMCVVITLPLKTELRHQ